MTRALGVLLVVAVAASAAGPSADAHTTTSRGVTVADTLIFGACVGGPDSHVLGCGSRLTLSSSRTGTPLGTPQVIQDTISAAGVVADVVESTHLRVGGDGTVAALWRMQDGYGWLWGALQAASGPVGGPYAIHQLSAVGGNIVSADARPAGVRVQWLAAAGTTHARLRVATLRGTNMSPPRTRITLHADATAAGEILFRRNSRGDELIAWHDAHGQVWVRGDRIGQPFGPSRRLGPGNLDSARLTATRQIIVAVSSPDTLIRRRYDIAL